MTDEKRKEHKRILRIVYAQISAVCEYIDSQDFGLARTSAYCALDNVIKLLERKGK